MEKLTYQQAYNKIIDAYFKNEIKPFNASFCFCGTLANGEIWHNNTHMFIPEKHNYTIEEYGRLEKALFVGFPEVKPLRPGFLWYEGDPDDFKKMSDYEDRLFIGMSNALEELKKIHIERGENVEEPEVKFVKRNKYEKANV